MGKVCLIFHNGIRTLLLLNVKVLNVNKREINSEHVLEVSKSPFLEKVGLKRHFEGSRNFGCNLRPPSGAKSYQLPSKLQSTQTKELQYKYYKYKQMMKKLENRILSELNVNCQFDQKSQQITFNKNLFDEMSQKLNLVSEKLSYYAHKLKQLGVEIEQDKPEVHNDITVYEQVLDPPTYKESKLFLSQI